MADARLSIEIEVNNEKANSNLQDTNKELNTLQTTAGEPISDPTTTVAPSIEELKKKITDVLLDAKDLQKEFNADLRDNTVNVITGNQELRQKIKDAITEVQQLQSELKNELKDPTGTAAQGSEELKRKFEELKSKAQEIQTEFQQNLPDPTVTVNAAMDTLKGAIFALQQDAKSLRSELQQQLNDPTLATQQGGTQLKEKMVALLFEITKLQTELKNDFKDPTNPTAQGSDQLKTKLNALTQEYQQLSSQIAKPLPDPTSTLHGALDGLNTKLQNLSNAMNVFSNLQGYASQIMSFATMLSNLGEKYQGLEAGIKNLQGTQMGAAVMEKLTSVAQQTNASLEATVQMYTRMAAGSQETGRSSQDLIKVTEALNNAVRLSGVSSEEASGALLQLSQAFNSGRLGGEEFNSVNENMPEVLRAVAKEMGVPYGALKDLSSQGKITSDVLITAITNMADVWKDKAANMPTTFTQSMENIKTSWMEFLSKSEASQGALSAIGQGLKAISDAGMSLVEAVGKVISGLSQISPTLPGITAGVTAVVGVFGGFNTSLGTLASSVVSSVSSFTGLSGGLSGIGAAASAAWPKLLAMATGLPGYGAALAAAVVASEPLGKAIGALGAVAGAFVSGSWSLIPGIFKEYWNEGGKVVEKNTDLTKAFNENAAAVTAAKTAYTNQQTAYDAITKKIDEQVTKLKAEGDGIKAVAENDKSRVELLNTKNEKYTAMMAVLEKTAAADQKSATEYKKLSDEQSAAYVALKGKLDERVAAGVKVTEGEQKELDKAKEHSEKLSTLATEQQNVAEKSAIAVEAYKKQAMESEPLVSSLKKIHETAQSVTFQGLLEQVQYSQDKFKATDDEIKKGLQVTLKSLSTQELVQLKEASGGVWNDAGEQGKAFAQVMDGVVSAAADKVGISLKGIGSSTKAGTDEGIQALQLVASSGQASSQEIVNAFTGLIKKAQTLEEIDALKAAFPDIASSAGASSTEIQQGQDQITLKFKEIEDAANKLTFKQQKEEVNGFLQAFKDGKGNLDDLKQAQDYLIQNFDVLNKSDLNTLQSAIDSTSSKLKSANENAVDLIESVHKGYLQSIDATTELKRFEEDVAHEETMTKLNKLLEDGNLIAEARTGVLSALNEEESRHEQAVVNINTAHEQEITKLKETAADLNATLEKRTAASTEIERQDGITNTLSSTYGSNGQAILNLKENVDEMITSMDAFSKSAIAAQSAYDIGWSEQGGPPGTMAEGGIIGASQSDLAALAQTGQLDVPHFAEGGVVDKPTVALIGEKGTEQIVPMADGGQAGVDLLRGNNGIIIENESVNNFTKDDKVKFYNTRTVAKLGEKGTEILLPLNKGVINIKNLPRYSGPAEVMFAWDGEMARMPFSLIPEENSNVISVREIKNLAGIKTPGQDELQRTINDNLLLMEQQNRKLAEGGIITQDNLVNAAMQGQLDVPHFAEGGVVDKPTVALIGEKGTEQIVPMAEGEQAGKNPIDGTSTMVNGKQKIWSDDYGWMEAEEYIKLREDKKNMQDISKIKQITSDDIQIAFIKKDENLIDQLEQRILSLAAGGIVDASQSDLAALAQSGQLGVPHFAGGGVVDDPTVTDKEKFLKQFYTEKAKYLEEKIALAVSSADETKLSQLEKEVNDFKKKNKDDTLNAKLDSALNIGKVKAQENFKKQIRKVANDMYSSWKKEVDEGGNEYKAIFSLKERLYLNKKQGLDDIYEEFNELKHPKLIERWFKSAAETDDETEQVGFLGSAERELFNNQYELRMDFQKLFKLLESEIISYYKKNIENVFMGSDVSLTDVKNSLGDVYDRFRNFRLESFDREILRDNIIKNLVDTKKFLSKVRTDVEEEFKNSKDAQFKSRIPYQLTGAGLVLYTDKVEAIIKEYEDKVSFATVEENLRREKFSANSIRWHKNDELAEGGVVTEESFETEKLPEELDKSFETEKLPEELDKSFETEKLPEELDKSFETEKLPEELDKSFETEKLPEELDKSFETEKLPAVKHKLLSKRMAAGGVIDDGNIEKLPHAAVGTIVNQPTVTTLGTKGAEAIIPLTRGPINLNKLPQYNGPTKALIGEAGAEVRMPLASVPVDRDGWVDKSRLPAMASGGIAGSGSGSVSIDYNAMANAIKNAMSGMTLSVTISSNGLTQAVITDIKNSKRNYA